MRIAIDAMGGDNAPDEIRSGAVEALEDLADEDDPAEAAHIVASRIATEGWKLYALQPERRDLEQIFSEISAIERTRTT